MDNNFPGYTTFSLDFLPQIEQAQQYLDSEFAGFCLENGLKTTLGPAKAFDAYGTPYTVISIGGVKAEGSPVGFVFPAENYKKGVSLFLQSVAEWLSNRKYLVLRRPPEITAYSKDHWKLTMRLSAYTDETVPEAPNYALHTA